MKQEATKVEYITEEDLEKQLADILADDELDLSTGGYSDAVTAGSMWELDDPQLPQGAPDAQAPAIASASKKRGAKKPGSSDPIADRGSKKASKFSDQLAKNIEQRRSRLRKALKEIADVEGKEPDGHSEFRREVEQRLCIDEPGKVTDGNIAKIYQTQLYASHKKLEGGELHSAPAHFVQQCACVVHV